MIVVIGLLALIAATAVTTVVTRANVTPSRDSTHPLSGNLVISGLRGRISAQRRNPFSPSLPASATAPDHGLRPGPAPPRGQGRRDRQRPYVTPYRPGLQGEIPGKKERS
jgi:hypothetical protein